MDNYLTIYIGDNETKYEIHTHWHFNKKIDSLKAIPGVWLFTKDGENGDIFITENLSMIETMYYYISFSFKGGQYHLQHYDTYNEAYDVALEMKSESRFVVKNSIN